jgi:hypothetical protein
VKKHIYKNIVLGELHGVQQNAEIIESIVRDCLNDSSRKLVVAFEWTLNNKEEKSINKFVLGKMNENDEEEFVHAIQTLYDQHSGVFSDQHYDLLCELRGLNKQTGNRVTIIAIDKKGEDWNDRDEKMAGRVKQTGLLNDTVIVIVGDLHARKRPFRFDEASGWYYPLAWHLPAGDTYSVRLAYSTGQFYNFGIQDIVAEKEGATEKDGYFYDEVMHLGPAKPITFNYVPH